MTTVKDIKNYSLNVSLGISLSLILGCNFSKDHSNFLDAVSGSGGNVLMINGIGVTGSGAGLPGSGDLSAPTGKAALLRINNGLEGSVAIYPLFTTNISNIYPRLFSNMTNTTDPTSYVGADTTMLLSYAACVDIVESSQSILSTRYGINVFGTLASNQTAIVNAGLRILDHQLAGLATGSSVTPQVTAALNGIMNQSITNNATTRMAFITMCMATSSAGATMMGF